MTERSVAAGARRPRVLVFAHSSGMAGAERSLLETLQVLVASHEVDVVVPAGGPFADAARAVPVARVHVVHQHSYYQEAGRGAWRRLAKAALALSAIVRSVLLLARTRPDLAYSNTVASWTGAVAARIARVPHVWHLREFPRADWVGLPVFGRRLERWVLGDLRTVLVCNSEFIRGWYQENFGRNATVAYQPVKVDEPAVAAAPAGRAQRDRLAVGVFGRIHPSKGQHVVVEALARLDAAERDRLAVHLYGEPIEPYATQLQELVARHGLQDCVHLHGFTAAPLDAMAGLDLVVVASLDEPFGRVCVEAMLLDVAVVGSDSGGTLELVGPEQQRGVLFRTGDPEALGLRLREFIADAQPFRARAETARAWARQRFSPAAYADTLRAAFAAAVAGVEECGERGSPRSRH